MECVSDFGTVAFFNVQSLTTAIYDSWIIYDDINEEIWSNFYSFRECVHSPLTDSHFRDPIPRGRKIDFEGRGREYGISECVQGIFVVHRSSNDNIGHIFMCRY